MFSESEDVSGDDGSFLKDEFLPNSFEYYLDILEELDEEDEEMEDDDDEDPADVSEKKTKPKTKGPDAGKDEKCKNQ